MMAQRESKQVFMPFVTPQMPKFVAQKKGGNSFASLLQQTFVSFMAQERRQPGAPHALQLPLAGTTGA